MVITPSAWATIATVFAEYSGAFVSLSSTGTRIVATVAIVFVTVVNVVSVRLSAAIQNVATSAKMLALAAIIGVLFAFGEGTHGAFASLGSGQVISLSGFVVGLVTALWAYDGLVPASSVFGEVRDPARTLPRAVVAGVLAVTVIYLGMNAALLYVMPVSAVAASKLVAADAMRAIAGQTGVSIVAAAVMLTTFGALASTALCDPRVVFATAHDGLFFRVIARVVSKRHRLLVGLWILIFVGALVANQVWRSGDVVSFSQTSSLPQDTESAQAQRIIDAEFPGQTSGSSATFGVTIDLTPPTAPAITGIATDSGSGSSDHITNDQTLILSGTAEANSLVTLTRTEIGIIGTTTANGSGNWTFDYTGTTLTEASHIFTAVATDSAGNVSPTSGAWSPKIVRGPPMLSARPMKRSASSSHRP